MSSSGISPQSKPSGSIPALARSSTSESSGLTVRQLSPEDASVSSISRLAQTVFAQFERSLETIPDLKEKIAKAKATPLKTGRATLVARSHELRVMRTADRVFAIRKPLGKGGVAVVKESQLLTDEGRVDRSSSLTVTRDQTISTKTVEHFQAGVRSAVFAVALQAQAHAAAPDHVIEIRETTVEERPTDTSSIVTFRTEMERAQSDLEAFLRETAPSTEQRIEILQFLIQGLGQIHEAGIWHLDIKPGNILVSLDGQPKWADFERGNAATFVTEASVLSQDQLTGNQQEALQHLIPFPSTPLFAPPEAWDRSQEAPLEDPIMGPRFDLFSLGCTIWKVLENDLPPSLAHRKAARGIACLLPAYGQVELAQHEAMVQKVESRADGPTKSMLLIACQCLHPDRMQRPANAHQVQMLVAAAFRHSRPL